MQESDNSLNKDYNNCVEMFFIHLKIFIFFSEFSQECLNISRFLDLLSGKSECLFPAPNTPRRTLHPRCSAKSIATWFSLELLCSTHTLPSFPKALTYSASLVTWPLPLLFQVPGMSVCTPSISLKGSSFTFRGFFPDELLQSDSCTASTNQVLQTLLELCGFSLSS